MFVAFFIVANVVSMAVSLVNRPCKLVGRIGAAGVSKQRVTSLITHARSIYCSLVQRLLVLLLYYCLYDNNKYRCNSDRSEPVNESTPRAFVMNFGLITRAAHVHLCMHTSGRVFLYCCSPCLLAISCSLTQVDSFKSSSAQKQFDMVSNYFFTYVFGVECFLKMVRKATVAALALVADAFAVALHLRPVWIGGG